jgi:hypothetical protein
VLLIPARRVVKVLTMALVLPVIVLLTWLVVGGFLNPSPASLYENFFIYTVLMAVPPVLACLFVLRVSRSCADHRGKCRSDLRKSGH